MGKFENSKIKLIGSNLEFNLIRKAKLQRGRRDVCARRGTGVSRSGGYVG